MRLQPPSNNATHVTAIAIHILHIPPMYPSPPHPPYSRPFRPFHSHGLDGLRPGPRVGTPIPQRLQPHISLISTHSYQFALKYPSLVSAVVVAGGAGRYGEQGAYKRFKKIGDSEAAAWCRRCLHTLHLHPLMRLTWRIRFRQQLQSRLTFGTIISLAVEWGLMPSFAPPNPNYGISLSKAREKVKFQLQLARVPLLQSISLHPLAFTSVLRRERS